MRFGSFSGRQIATMAGALAATLCAAPSAAAAADGFGPLSGDHGCLVASGGQTAEDGTSGCGKAKGLYGARAVAVSPDGANVYVASGIAGDNVAKSYGAVAILERDQATGAITEVGCLSSDGTDHQDGASGACTPEPSLLGTSGVAVSPDGKTVYVSSSSSASVVAFARNATTGALTRLGCFQGTPRPSVPCGAASLMPSASSPVVSADGSALYVAAPLAGAVSSLDSSDSLHTPTGVVPAASVGATATADPTGTGTATTGASTTSPAATSPAASATEPPSTAAIPDLSSIFATSLGGDELLNPCIAVNGLDGACSVGVATQGLGDLALSPDGKQIYGAASGSAAIDVFTHAAAGGLTEAGCIKLDAPRGLCSSTSILNEPSKLAVSPDGKNVYVADKGPGYSGGQLDVLARNQTTGALSASGCVQFAPKPEPKEEDGEEGGEGEEENEDEQAKPAPKGKRASAGCSSAAGLDSVSVVAVSGDGSSVYAIGNGAAAIFSRDAATGQLSEASCAVNEDPRCTSFPPLEGVTDAAVSPDGRQVYVVAFGTNAVRVFGIGAAVTNGHAATTRAGTARVRVACPSGLRRACSGRVQLTRTVARAARHGRHGRHGVQVRRVTAGASAAFSIAPGQHASVRVQLTRHMRRLLAKRHHVRLMAVVRANPSAGGSGYGHHVTLLLRRR